MILVLKTSAIAATAGGTLSRSQPTNEATAGMTSSRTNPAMFFSAGIAVLLIQSHAACAPATIFGPIHSTNSVTAGIASLRRKRPKLPISRWMPTMPLLSCQLPDRASTNVLIESRARTNPVRMSGSTFDAAHWPMRRSAGTRSFLTNPARDTTTGSTSLRIVSPTFPITRCRPTMPGASVQ
jgi:hypothetical protein